MLIEIKSAIMHILDTNNPVANISKSELIIDDITDVYISNLILKNIDSDDVKKGTLSLENSFLKGVIYSKDDLVNLSEKLILQIFKIMHMNKDIPRSDVILGFCLVDGV